MPDSPRQTESPPTAVDLFAGAGGLSLGLREAGFELLAAADSWSPAVESYRLNFRHPMVDVDLASLPTAQIRAALGIGETPLDLVAGGPPCQGFSIQRIGTDEDERNDLVMRFASLVVALEPQLFVMENVPGLLGKRGRRLAARFEQTMARAGYVLRDRILNAADFGVPQLRRRVFLIGARIESDLSPTFPVPTVPTDAYYTVWDAIGDLPEPLSGKNENLPDPLHRRMSLSPLNRERLELIPPGGGFEDLPVDMRVNAHKSGADRIGHRNVYGRLHPDRPASTITARFDSFTRGKFAHPHEHRNITLREGARLQSFPDWYGFQGTQEEIAALIGNAVPPLLAAAVGRALLQSIRAEPPASPLSSGAQLTIELLAGAKDAGATEDVGRIPSSDFSTPA